MSAIDKNTSMDRHINDFTPPKTNAEEEGMKCPEHLGSDMKHKALSTRSPLELSAFIGSARFSTHQPVSILLVMKSSL